MGNVRSGHGIFVLMILRSNLKEQKEGGWTDERKKICEFQNMMDCIKYFSSDPKSS